jgi:tetratricopeptide (TPR) repeat protein
MRAKSHAPAPQAARAAMLAAIACLVAMASARAARADDDPGRVSRRARAYQAFLEAETLMLDRRIDAAAGRLETAAALFPDPTLLIEAARAARALGDSDRALAFVQEALAARPGWGTALRERADLRMERALGSNDPLQDLEAALEDLRSAMQSDADSSQATVAFAELSSRLGRTGEAIDALLALRARRPLLSDAAILLGRLALADGRDDLGGSTLEAVVAREPQNLEAIDLLASLYESQERYDEAIALYNPLLEERQVRPLAEERIGLLQLSAGRADAAVATLLQAGRDDPSETRVQLLLARGYEAQGDIEAARASCETFLLVEPESIEGLFERARLLRQEGDGESARRGFEEVIRQIETHGTPGPATEATETMAWAQIGVLAASARDWDGAAEALRQAADHASDPQPDLLRLLARAELERGDAAAAETIARAVLSLNPADTSFGALLGEALLVRGDPAGARARFRDLLAASHHASEAYLSVIDALLKRQRAAEAEAMAREGLLKHPGDDGLLFARGAALEKLGRLKEAERSLGQAVVANPNNAMALNYLGFLLAEHGQRLADSILYVKRAVALDPENPAYLDSLGWALFKMARYTPAEEMLRTAMRYDSFDPAIREHLGDLLIATGRRGEAVRQWQAALEYGHERPDRIRAKLDRARSVPGGEQATSSRPSR